MHLKKALAAAFVVSTAPQAAESSAISDSFCEVANQYGARSWQAISVYDADAHHNGVNYYLMPANQRSDALDENAPRTFSPALQQTLKDRMLTQYLAFDDMSRPEKLVKMIVDSKI